MSLVKGIHHIALKCCSEQEYEKTRHFYKEILELEEVRAWDTGCMFNTGAGLMEIFNDGECPLGQGTIRHFALATDDVDACAKKVKEAGYEVFIEPNDIVISSTPEFPARIAFCREPVGEEIEFFQER